MFHTLLDYADGCNLGQAVEYRIRLCCLFMYLLLIAAFNCIEIHEFIRGVRVRLILKCLHSISMVYSWIMLVDVRISFLFRAENQIYTLLSSSLCF